MIKEYYEKNRKRHVNAINKIVNNYSTAEDIVQDAFLKAIVCINNYNENKGRFRDWFSRILYNTLCDFLKKEPELFSEDYLNQQEKQYIDYTVIIDNFNSFIKSMDFKDHKQVLILFFIKGYSYKEIMNITGKSYNQIEYICKNFRQDVRI